MPTFTKSTGITFADNTTVSQTIAVSGLTSPITQISVALGGLTHTFPGDLDFLLVGPDGTSNLLFFSDAGSGLDITNATFTIADSGAAPLPDLTQLVTGTTYQPADNAGNDPTETDGLFGSATGGINHATPTGTATFASAFNGLDPNGTWTLYARDDAGNDVGTLAHWSLTILTAGDLVIDGTAGVDTLEVTAFSPTSGQYVLNGGSAVPFSDLQSLTFNGLGSDDVLRIINPGNGVLAVPIDYDGGGDPGDALEILDGTSNSATYTVLDANSGIVAHQANEVQHVSVSGTSGTFSLTFNGQTTPTPLAFDATAAAVQAALNGLPTIGGAGGSVAVTGSAGSYSITFGGSMTHNNVPQLIGSGAGGATPVISTLTHGGVQTLTFTGLAPMTDTVTETTYTVLGTPGADTITITDGGLVGGAQTWLISSPTFESVRVANKTNIVIDGNGGGDTVSMDTSVQAAGLLGVLILGVDSVSETGAFIVQTLRIEAANSVVLTGANNVDTLSATMSAINGFVEFRDTNGFTVDGISTNGGRVTLATDFGGITVGTSSPGTGINTGAAGNIVRLQATTGDVTQTANGAIVSDLLGIRAGASVALTAALNDNASIAIAAGGQVEYRDSGDVTISAVGASGPFTLLTGGVSSGGNNINLQIGGNLLLNDAVGATPSIDAGAGDIRIVAGTVNQINPGDNIVGDELGIIATGAVTLTLGDNDVNALAVATTGLVEFRDIDDLIVAAVAAGGGAGFTGASGISSGGSNVNLQAGTSLQFGQGISAGTGDVRLVAGSISQAVSSAIVADELGAIASLGAVNLFGTILNDVSTVAISATAGAAYQDADGVTIGVVTPGGNAGFTGAVIGMTGTSVAVLTVGPITVANNVTATAGNVSLQAADTLAPGDDLTVNGGVAVQATADIALHSGDNLNLLAGSSLIAGSFIQGVVDFNNADAGLGGIANLNGSITAPGVFFGLDDGDTFFSAAGPDFFQGNAGNDRFVWDPGDGSDTIDGGADTDTLAFNGAAGAEVFALNPAGATALFTRDVGAITMTMSAVERLELAAGNGINQFTVADMSATALTGPISYTGGSGIDTIAAAAAVNPFNIAAGGGNDQIATGAGTDRLKGEGGDDLLDGGGGNDIAVFGGNLADYQFAFLPGELRIADLRSGAPDGSDTLHDIENAEFANATLSIQSLTAADDSFVPAGNQAVSAGLGNDTITFDFRLVDATIIHAGNAILIESGASHTVVNGFETFVFTDGTVINNDGERLVDDLFYYAQNHDVWNAHVDADQHFQQFGRQEGRDPNAFFSISLYLSANPDLQAAGVDPLAHFDGLGFIEGRVPSLTFDPRAYLAANPDVAAAGADPLRHYLQFGYQEGRVPFAASELVTANGFDYVFYLQHNPDVAAAHVDPLVHFQTVGWLEGRDPNALFDVNGYLAAYSDVAAAGVNPLDHYNQFGRHEGRDPSGGFDTTSYLAANPDVAAAGVNPLVHFLTYGIHEGRSPFADGVFG